MRLFHALVLDQCLENAGFGALYKVSEAWCFLLMRAESLKFFCVVDRVSGASTTLTVKLHGAQSANYLSAHFETTKVLLDDVTLNPGTNVLTAVYSPQDAGNPAPGYLFLNLFLAGTTPKAHVRLWVCGRGSQVLEPPRSGSPTFVAQYAAARILEDEDRLPVRKRTAKARAPVAAPALFVPSLEWER